jgi:tetratricopeptide (TPR) repeat protein
MVAKVPDQYISWDGLAEGYRAAGDMERALQCYEMASKFGYLREIESYHLARIYLDRGDFEKAHKHIWGLLLKSKSKEGLLLLGEYYGATGAYLDAEKQLKAYLEAFPGSAEGLFKLGKVYFMMGKLDNARVYYGKALGAGGDGAELFFALACLESMGGNMEQSLGYLEKAVGKGLDNRQLLEEIPYLARVRKHPGYALLVQRHFAEESRPR